MNFSQYDLNQLLVLDAVLNEGSVAKAACKLHVTSSAVSNTLARLRSNLGDPLVVRRGRGIVPTPRGAAIAPKLRQALGDLDRSVRQETFDPKTSGRRFTIAMADAGQISRLPALYRALGEAMPSAQLSVVGIDTYMSQGGLAGGDIDVALVAVADNGPGIHQMPLYPEESVLVGRKTKQRVAGRLGKEALSELLHAEVQVAPGRGYRNLSLAYAKAGIERKIAVTVPSFMAAAAVVSGSDLVATLPSSLVARVGGILGLCVLRSPAPTVAIQIKLVWHARTHNDPACRMFREVVAKALTLPQ